MNTNTTEIIKDLETRTNKYHLENDITRLIKTRENQSIPAIKRIEC